MQQFHNVSTSLGLFLDNYNILLLSHLIKPPPLKSVFFFPLFGQVLDILSFFLYRFKSYIDSFYHHFFSFDILRTNCIVDPVLLRLCKLHFLLVYNTTPNYYKWSLHTFLGQYPIRTRDDFYCATQLSYPKVGRRKGGSPITRAAPQPFIYENLKGFYCLLFSALLSLV